MRATTDAVHDPGADAGGLAAGRPAEGATTVPALEKDIATLTLTVNAHIAGRGRPG